MKRKVIVACTVTGCLILFGVIFAANSANRQVNEQGKPWEINTNMAGLEISNNLQKYGIEIVGTSDVKFDAEFTKYLGNSEGDVSSILRAAKPLSIFIVNHSDKDVVGYTLQWEFSKSDGSTEVVPQSMASPGVLMGMKTLDPAMEGKTSLVARKGTGFFSFDKSLEAILMKMNIARKNPELSNSLIHNGFDDDLSKIESNIDRLLSSSNKVSVSIDGIFFSDGTFIGDDKFFFFDLMRGGIEARKYLIKLISKTSSKRVNVSEVLDRYLSEHQIRPRSSAPFSSNDAAFKEGYDSFAYSMAKEISRLRSKSSDQTIALYYSWEGDPKKVALRKEN